MSALCSLAHLSSRFRQFALHGKLDWAVNLNPHSHIHTHLHAHIHSHAFVLYWTLMICKWSSGCMFWIHLHLFLDKLIKVKNALECFCSVVIRSLLCHVCLRLIFIVSLFSLPSDTDMWFLSDHPSAVPQPPTSVSGSLPHFLLSSMPLLSIYLPSFPSLSPPLSSSSHCALDSLSFPLAHTLRQHPPLSISTFTLTSLCSSHLLPLRHLLTQIIRLLSSSPSTLSSISSNSFLLLTHSASLSLANTRAHTHSCWLGPKDRASSLPSRQPEGLLVWPGFLTLSSAEEEDEEEAMEHSHIFPVFSQNESTRSLGQQSSEVAQGCPLGPLPVIYYSVLLCLGLPGNWRVLYIYVHISLCVHFIIFVIRACIGGLLVSGFASWFVVHSSAGLSVCVCVSCTAAPECQSLQKHCWFVILTLWQSLVHV